MKGGSKRIKTVWLIIEAGEFIYISELVLKPAFQPASYTSGGKDKFTFLLLRSRHFRHIITLSAFIAVIFNTPLSIAARQRPSEAELRHICLNALGKKSGAAVIVKIKTGEVVTVSQGLERGERYFPGSVAKLITAHAGLESGILSRQTIFPCHNALRIRNQVYHCTLPGGHGKPDLGHALAQSCNVWFYQAAEAIGPARILKSWREFGLKSVILPDKIISAARLGVGEEGLKITPLEMARIAQIVAMKKVNPSGSCAIIAKGMRMVVTDGTARALLNCGVAAAGKTGSPHHFADPEKRHGWFIGFAPYDRPEIAFAVFCLEGNAYRSAVPVAKKILEGYFDPRS